MNTKLNLTTKSLQIQNMFDKISPQYNFLNRLLSFGQDVRWRNYLIKKIPKINSNDGVLYDIACGTGDILFTCLKSRPDYKTLVGFDISPGMLSQLRAHPSSDKVTEILASAEQLPAENNSAHCVTIAFGLRNVDDREKALKEFHRVLKNGGSLFVLDFFPSKSSLFQKLFNFYFNKILPKIGGLFSDKSAYTYLPQSVRSMPSQSEFISLLSRHGFSQIESQGWLSNSTMLFSCVKLIN